MVIAQRRSVLVVEDNAADAGLVADALEGATSTPLLSIASGGAAALQLLSAADAHELPSFVLLDLTLPGACGLQTLGYELGAAAVVNKPLRLREYRDMLGAFERFWLGHVRLASGRCR